MAGMLVRGEDGPPERDGVAVLERAVDFHGLEAGPRRVAEAEVQPAAGLEQFLVLFRDDKPCAGHAFQLRHARDVVEVAVRGGQDLRVSKVEPESFHTCLDLLRRVTNTGVDQDVSLWRGDQIRGQIVRTYPVEVPDDTKRREGAGPIRVALGEAWRGEREASKHQERDQSRQHKSAILRARFPDRHEFGWMKGLPLAPTSAARDRLRVVREMAAETDGV